MKYSSLLTVLALWAVAGPVLSQTPVVTGSKTPIFQKVVVTPTPYPTPIYSPAPQLDKGLKQAMLQVSKDWKAGKLTKAQADSLRSQIKAIRQQELADIKANGKRLLTSDQETQLVQKLDKIRPSL